jgi:hypothetical protein
MPFQITEEPESVIQGGSIDLTAEFIDFSGNVLTPTNVRVSIFDPNGTLMFSGGVPTRQPDGTYVFVFNVATNALLGSWRAHWDAVESGGAVVGDEVFYVTSMVPIAPARPPIYYLPDLKQYTIDQETMRHNEALYAYGEYSIFVLTWRIQDLQAGRVTRCHVCYARGRTSSAYGQSDKEKCLNCYGTTFEGGIRAQIVRPALWTDTNEDTLVTDARGQVLQSDAKLIQTTSDFTMRSNDYVFRYDGTRWQVGDPRGDRIHTGFGPIGSQGSLIGFNLTSVNREDEASVAYLIPPDPASLMALLNVTGTRAPLDWSGVDVINAPLLV